MNLCSHYSLYSLNRHVGAMLVFHMLCRITQSLDMHRTESVSVMDHEQTMRVNGSVGPETAMHYNASSSLWTHLEALRYDTRSQGSFTCTPRVHPL